MAKHLRFGCNRQIANLWIESTSKILIVLWRHLNYKRGGAPVGTVIACRNGFDSAFKAKIFLTRSFAPDGLIGSHEANSTLIIFAF